MVIRSCEQPLVLPNVSECIILSPKNYPQTFWGEFNELAPRGARPPRNCRTDDSVSSPPTYHGAGNKLGHKIY